MGIYCAIDGSNRCVAAVNINGTTINIALAIPKKREIICQQCQIKKGHKLRIALDEISMVSNLMLLHIHQRLKGIFAAPSSKLGPFQTSHFSCIEYNSYLSRLKLVLCDMRFRRPILLCRTQLLGMPRVVPRSPVFVYFSIRTSK